MATTLTTNLKLRVSDDLTADATYNLNRIDTNAGAVTTDSSGNLEVYAAEDVFILPQAPDKDGTGLGGTVELGTANHDITTNLYGTTNVVGDLTVSTNATLTGELRLEGGSSYAGFAGSPSLTSPHIWTLPTADGAINQVLITDGAYGLSWATVVTDSLGENSMRVGNASGVSADTDTSILGDIFADSITGLTIKNGVIENSQVSGTAAIETSKLEALTANVVPQLNASGFISASAVTNTELSYLSGTSSSVQDQLDARAVRALNLSDLTNTTTARTNLGVAIGSDVQAWNSDLDSISSLTGTTDHVIIGNGSTWIQSAFTNVSGAQQTVTTWTNGDGATKVITHSFNNQRVLVQIWDQNDEQIFVDSVDQTDADTVTLTASVAPTTSWTVTIKEVV